MHVYIYLCDIQDSIYRMEGGRQRGHVCYFNFFFSDGPQLNYMKSNYDEIIMKRNYHEKQLNTGRYTDKMTNVLIVYISEYLNFIHVSF